MDPVADVVRARRWLERLPPSSRAVHEARKRLRRARSVLRLGRGTPVGRECERAGAACRRAARALAPMRDARVFAETLEELLARKGGELSAPAAARARALAVRARRSEARSLAQGAALRRAKSALGRRPRGPAPAAFDRAVEPTLKRALRKAYRRARRDLRAVRSAPLNDRFHALRKDSKALLHELEETRPRSEALPRLRRLNDLLGREHDLAMLLVRLGRRKDGAEIGRLARRRRRRLRRRALALAGDLYSRHGRNVALKKR